MRIKSKSSGAHFERKAKKILEKKGWLVTRAGASLGDDLVAVWPKPIAIETENGEVYPIFKCRRVEVKARISKYQVDYLIKHWKKKKELWVKHKRGKWYRTSKIHFKTKIGP